MANYKRTDLAVPSDPNMPDPGDILMLAPVKSYWPCSFGTYNMAGNAAEMISTKGITKGGGFIDTEIALPLDAKGLMEAPASHIGFRYFVELLPDFNTDLHPDPGKYFHRNLRLKHAV